ncbi:hypothetical protein RI049_09650 [Cedecea neteri]|uniref:hypothetical protein n=1 Tax=Cedecea neteri TaxID=158822 RepID=UPI002AA85258|nr:hypothetical protein [Cedecea neteri]WPU24977.1 hypothetical protein RI049_09650 [Cedecea neteri]
MEKSTSYFIVYCGEHHPSFAPGSPVFIQRTKEQGGGYWLGRVYNDFYEFCFNEPIPLRRGIDFLFQVNEFDPSPPKSVDEFSLEPPDSH